MISVWEKKAEWGVIGKTDKTSKNNEITGKLALCSIKTGVLKVAREQIQNELSRIIDHSVGNTNK